MKNIKDICSAKPPLEFVNSSKLLLECAGISGDKVKEFVDTVFETFDDFKPDYVILDNDYSV